MSNEPSSPFMEPLRDAFAAFALESGSPSASEPSNGAAHQLSGSDASLTRRAHLEGRNGYNLEPQVMQSQLNSTRPLTISDLWADHNSSQTMSLLHSQFVNELNMDPSQLTVEDYVKLFRQNFQELNDEIMRDGQQFVEDVQEYELSQQQEEQQRRLPQEQEQRQLLNARTALPHQEMHEVPYGGSFYSTSVSAFPDSEVRGSRDRSQTGQRLPPRHLPGCPQAMVDLHSPCQLCGAGMRPVSYHGYHSMHQTSGSYDASEHLATTNVPYHPTTSSSQQQYHQRQHQHYQPRDYRAPRRVRSFHETQ